MNSIIDFLNFRDKCIFCNSTLSINVTSGIFELKSYLTDNILKIYSNDYSAFISLNTIDNTFITSHKAPNILKLFIMKYCDECSSYRYSSNFITLDFAENKIFDLEIYYESFDFNDIFKDKIWYSFTSYFASQTSKLTICRTITGDNNQLNFDTDIIKLEFMDISKMNISSIDDAHKKIKNMMLLG